jgi:hypothetical protein
LAAIPEAEPHGVPKPLLTPRRGYAISVVACGPFGRSGKIIAPGGRIPDHAQGLPVLRALSLCTCCRHYPGAAAGRSLRSCHPTVSAFPGSTSGSACTSTFSRIARRLLALRPAHSRGHQFRDCYPGASDISSPPCLPRLLPAGAVAGRGLHPLEKRRLVTAHVEISRW